jgi:2'-5' RNA ligase
MRLFIGIPLSAVVIDELSAITARLQSNGRGLRWTARESWHITLQFLGNTGAEQCGCVVARLHELHSPPAPIRIEGLSCFDRAGIHPRGSPLPASHHLGPQPGQRPAA